MIPDNIGVPGPYWPCTGNCTGPVQFCTQVLYRPSTGCLYQLFTHMYWPSTVSVEFSLHWPSTVFPVLTQCKSHIRKLVSWTQVLLENTPSHKHSRSEPKSLKIIIHTNEDIFFSSNINDNRWSINYVLQIFINIVHICKSQITLLYWASTGPVQENCYLYCLYHPLVKALLYPGTGPVQPCWLGTHLLTASIDPGMGTPPPSPLSYNTPDMSSKMPLMFLLLLYHSPAVLSAIFVVCGFSSRSTEIDWSDAR